MGCWEYALVCKHHWLPGEWRRGEGHRRKKGNKGDSQRDTDGVQVRDKTLELVSHRMTSRDVDIEGRTEHSWSRFGLAGSIFP